jgi:hypothetical protein
MKVPHHILGRRFHVDAGYASLLEIWDDFFSEAGPIAGLVIIERTPLPDVETLKSYNMYTKHHNLEKLMQ